jgi:type IV pilus assembly protein PilO
MATQEKAKRADVAGALRGGLSQFRDLNPNQPGQWPLLPRLTVWAVVAVLVIVAGWFLALSDQSDQLQAARDKEPTLKSEYLNKLAQAINLEALKRQKEEVQGYVTQLEKQLPGKAEMDALLSDINNAGIGRGLVIDQFIPGQTETKDYYAELPIAIRVSGKYHDIGAFAADIAALSRIVTLHNLTITPGGDARSAPGTLSMEATARTYRYLDDSEVAAARKATTAAAAAKEKK